MSVSRRPAGPAASRPPAAPRAPWMQSSRKRPRSRPAARAPGVADMEFVSRVRDVWDSSSPGERSAYAACVVVAGMVASWILNTLMGVFSLLLFGVFALPVMLVAASTGFAIIATGFAGLIALSAVSTVGFGVIGIPLLVTGGILSKLLGPLLVAAPVYMMSRVVRSTRGREDGESDAFFEEDDDFERDDDNVDFFSAFDRKLENRVGVRLSKPDTVPSGDLLGWSVQDCVSSLRSAGLVNASRIIGRERVDGQVLAMMDEREIADELAGGLSVGEKKKLIAWARHFRS